MRRTKEISAAGVLLPVLIILGVTACELPPFDEGLSLALIAARNMRLETEIGPINFQDNFQEDTEHFYVPANTTLADGFIVSRRKSSYSITHFSPDGAVPPEYWPDGRYDDWVMSRDYMPSSQFHPLGYIDPDVIMIFAKHDQTAVSDLLFRKYCTASNMTDYGAGPESAQTLAQGAVTGTVETVVGLEAFPPPLGAAPQPQTLHMLVRDTTGLYYEVTNSISGSGSLGGAVQTTTYSLSAIDSLSPLDAAYHYDEVRKRSYFSAWDSAVGRFRSFVWYDNPASPGTPLFKELVNVGRIDRVLTTGDLYVDEKESARVFDKDGDFKFKFSHGELKLVFEYWDASETRYRCAFSLLSQDFAGQEGGEKLWARVYSIPTSDLKKLD